MPLIDITRPDVIKFLVENYDKVARLRMRWNNLYGEKLLKAATITDEKGYYDTDVYEAAMVCGMPAITRDHVTAASIRRKRPIRDGVHVPALADLRKGHSIPEVGLGDAKEDPRLACPDTDLTPSPIMRPVDPKERKIIYKDIPTYGRQAYLKSRNKKQPEKKFYFEECSGWTCGWRLGDSYFGRNAPRYGRVSLLSREGKSRTGAQPDPLHYATVVNPGPTKCIAQ